MRAQPAYDDEFAQPLDLESPFMAHRSFSNRYSLDPRKANVTFDANTFDGVGPDDPDVHRLVELVRSRSVRLVMPYSVWEEIQNPRTPAPIRDLTESLIFTVPREKTASERELYRRVRDILQGNAAPGKHDADARHITDAARHSYFITHDRRIIHTKLQALEAVLPPSLRIVTLAEFLKIYDTYGTGQ